MGTGNRDPARRVESERQAASHVRDARGILPNAPRRARRPKQDRPKQDRIRNAIQLSPVIAHPPLLADKASGDTLPTFRISCPTICSSASLSYARGFIVYHC